MTTTIGTAEAKARLSELLDRVEKGEEIIIERYGKPVAKLVAAPPAEPRKSLIGAMEGQIWMADDFDGPLPADIQAYFDGEIDDFTDEPIKDKR